MEDKITYVRLEGSIDFIVRKKFPSGMTGEFGVHPYLHETNIEGCEIFISLVLFRKRKTREKLFGSITGRDYLRPAVWAKECLEGVETMLWTDLFVDAPPQVKHADICIAWETPRLKEVYGLILYPKGYDLGKDSAGEWVYRKRFYRNGGQ